MSRFASAAFGVAVACATGNVAEIARASAPDHYAFGAQAAAMAGAAAARADGHAAVYYNPAGLAETPGVEVALGYSYNHVALAVGGQDNNVSDVSGIAGGLAVPGRVAGLPFAFGIALQMPDSALSYVHARRQEQPRWELYDARDQLLFLGATLAIKPASWLAIGGGVGFLSATRGRFGVRGRADILSPFDSDLEHEVDADLTAVRFPLLGLRIRHARWGALAVTYRGQSDLDLQIDANLAGVVDFAGIEVPLHYVLAAHAISAFTPQQLVLGASVERWRPWAMTFDITWLNWSAYESPTAAIAADLDVDVPAGLPIAVPTSPAPTAVVPPAFRNTLSFRSGIEYAGLVLGSKRVVFGQREALVSFPLRLGYAFDPSPIPPQRGTTSFLDADRHTLSGGFGATFSAPSDVIRGQLHVDVYGAWSVLPTRVETKSSPADFTGDYEAGGKILSVGAGLRLVL